MKTDVKNVLLPLFYIAQINGFGYSPTGFKQEIKGHKAVGEFRSAPVDPCPQRGSKRGRMIRGGIEVIDSNETVR